MADPRKDGKMTTKTAKALPKLHPMAKELINLLRRRENIDDDIMNVALKLVQRAQQADALGSLTLMIERGEEG